MFKRFQAINMLLVDASPDFIFKAVFCGRRKLTRWIALWNSGGVDALFPQKHTGRPRIISDQDKERVIDLLKPPGAVDETPWAAKKIHGYITKEWNLKLSYFMLTKNFREWGFRLKVPRI